ncbi:MAG TPA: YciI family protein [Vicinamibacteria bacterium]|nr:YciI family protein [Vicinamibacteria bacterium]
MRWTLSALLLLLNFPVSVAAEDGKPEMTTYYFGMLMRGPKWSPEETPERAELQQQHLAYMDGMHKKGRLLIAGPLTDDGTLRGLVVYKAASIEEARGFAEADPAVRAGRLKVELHPWMVKKGILREPEIETRSER